jgi:hypothetical protein
MNMDSNGGKSEKRQRRSSSILRVHHVRSVNEIKFTR